MSNTVTITKDTMFDIKSSITDEDIKFLNDLSSVIMSSECDSYWNYAYEFYPKWIVKNNIPKLSGVNLGFRNQENSQFKIVTIPELKYDIKSKDKIYKIFKLLQNDMKNTDRTEVTFKVEPFFNVKSYQFSSALTKLWNHVWIELKGNSTDDIKLNYGLYVFGETRLLYISTITTKKFELKYIARTVRLYRLGDLTDTDARLYVFSNTYDYGFWRTVSSMYLTSGSSGYYLKNQQDNDHGNLMNMERLQEAVDLITL